MENKDIELRRKLKIEAWNLILGYETPEPESEFTSPGQSITEYMDYCLKNELQVTKSGLESLSWKSEAPNRPPNFYRMRKFSESQIEKVSTILSIVCLNTEFFVVLNLTEASQMVSYISLDGRILDAAECTLTGADHFFSEEELTELPERIEVLREGMNRKLNTCIKHALQELSMVRLEDAKVE